MYLEPYIIKEFLWRIDFLYDQNIAIPNKEDDPLQTLSSKEKIETQKKNVLFHLNKIFIPEINNILINFIYI